MDLVDATAFFYFTINDAQHILDLGIVIAKTRFLKLLVDNIGTIRTAIIVDAVKIIPIQNIECTRQYKTAPTITPHEARTRRLLY